MNTHFKTFLHRGLIFGGFGPIVLSIVYYIISKTVTGFSLDGDQILLGIISVYILAFIHAGVSVFNQIEKWSIARSLLCHFSTLYFAYVFCYIINSWIPFSITVILIFTLIFIIVYFVIWFSVFISTKALKKKLNKNILQ